ncbi:RNA polymerase sigma factor [Agrobacterium tumefaciens]|uniref:RNA polymerase sigma factor n=1 Tax=Agrobacterium tumefaciens TaxID=358 RepID=UPI00287DEF36|nr:RNA polymerase sigma factor [Agrobacterium tumefaciens]MDS7594728.1 RNA polymerase sigma factor [Agrobacterium tumefaciens]
MGIREDDKRFNAYVVYRIDLIKYATLILGSRADAEDVVQEAFLKFVPETSSNPSNLKSYLFRIVRNLALDSRRRGRLDMRERPDDTPFWGLPQDQGTPEDHALFCDEIRRMQDVLSTLPAEARIALEMHRFGGYNLEEIASHLGISVAGVHRQIKDCIAAITKEMK